MGWCGSLPVDWTITRSKPARSIISGTNSAGHLVRDVQHHLRGTEKCCCVVRLKVFVNQFSMILDLADSARTVLEHFTFEILCDFIDSVREVRRDIFTESVRETLESFLSVTIRSRLFSR